MLEIFLLNYGIKPIFYESEYNKYYEDAVFGNSELDEFDPDIIYIHTTNRNIINYPTMYDTLEEVKVNEKRKIIPTVCISKNIFTGGDGSVNNPYVVEWFVCRRKIIEIKRKNVLI